MPRILAYHCEDGGELRVERKPGSVAVTDTEGAVVTLPPAPPNQQARYGADGYALVIEGNDLLWMKAGRTPLDCVL